MSNVETMTSTNKETRDGRNEAGQFVIRSSLVIRISALLAIFASRPGRRFLFVFALHADLFQERLDRLFATKKFFDRHRHVAPVALRVNLLAQFHSGLFVEITILG